LHSFRLVFIVKILQSIALSLPYYQKLMLTSYLKCTVNLNLFLTNFNWASLKIFSILLMKLLVKISFIRHLHIPSHVPYLTYTHGRLYYILLAIYDSFCKSIWYDQSQLVDPASKRSRSFWHSDFASISRILFLGPRESKANLFSDTVAANGHLYRSQFF